jgi:hypothetical protein
MESLGLGLGQTTKAEQEGCSRGVRRIFTVRKADDVGCVDWYQYPGATECDGSRATGR